MSKQRRLRTRESVAAACLTLAVVVGCAVAHAPDLPDGLPGNTGGKGAEIGGADSSGGPSVAGNPASNPSGGKAGAASAGAPGSAAGSANNAGSHTGGTGGFVSGGSAGSKAGGAGGRPGAAGSTASAGGPPTGTVLFSDDFEDGTVDGWVNTNGTWAIVTDGSKVYAQQATATGSMLLVSSSGTTNNWADQSVQAKVKVIAFGGQSTSYFAAIYARYSSAGYYSLTLRSDGRVAIRKGGSTLGSPPNVGIVPGTWYTVRLDVIGSTLNAYVDGVLKATETDSSITTGGFAISTVNTTAEFDDIKVSAP